MRVLSGKALHLTVPPPTMNPTVKPQQGQQTVQRARSIPNMTHTTDILVGDPLIQPHRPPQQTKVQWLGRLLAFVSVNMVQVWEDKLCPPPRD